jgi:hypothetical protein
MPYTIKRPASLAKATSIIIKATWHQVAACACLLALCMVNAANVFVGYDGEFYRQKFLHWLDYGTPRAFLTYDIFQGVGDIEFPLNFWFSLPTLATRLFYILGRTELLYYYFASLLVFLLTAVLLRAAHFSSLASSALSVVFTGLILKYFGPFSIYPIYSISPWSVEVMIVCTAMAALFVPIFGLETTARSRVVSILGFYALAFVVAMLVPGSFVSLAPLIGVVLVVFCIARLRLFWSAAPRSLLLFAALGILFAIVLGPYLLGIVLNTASSVFPGELTAPRDRVLFISTFFVGLRILQDNPYDQNSLFYVLSVAGLFYATLALNNGMRLLFAAALICLLLLNVLGAYTIVNARFAGVSPIYFEWNIWPLMFVAAMCGLRGAGLWIVKRSLGEVWLAEGTRETSLSRRLHGGALALLFLMMFAVTWPWLAKDRYPFPRSNQTADIVSDLETAIGANGGRPLRGRMINLTGTGARDSNGLLFWYGVASSDVRYQNELGNDLRTYGPWSRGIPTVLQYNQIMSPIYYYVATRAFAQPGDQRIRSLLMMSRIDSKWLKIMGVRYILSDVALDAAGLRLAKTYPMSSPPRNPLLLYEVEGWRPFTVLQSVGDGDIIAEMNSERDAGLPPQGDAEIEVDAKESGVTVSKSGGGTAFIAVPIIYSHCFTIPDRATEAGVTLFPAYGATLGVVVPAAGSFRLVYKNGPFNNPWCRVEDWRDARRTFPFDSKWVAPDRLFEVR